MPVSVQTIREPGGTENEPVGSEVTDPFNSRFEIGNGRLNPGPTSTIIRRVPSSSGESGPASPGRAFGRKMGAQPANVPGSGCVELSKLNVDMPPIAVEKGGHTERGPMGCGKNRACVTALLSQKATRCSP